MLFLKIMGGIAALLAGLYWGMAGDYHRSDDEINQALASGGRTRRVRRRFTPLGWMRKVQRASHRRRQKTRRAFDLTSSDSGTKPNSHSES